MRNTLEISNRNNEMSYTEQKVRETQCILF